MAVRYGLEIITKMTQEYKELPLHSVYQSAEKIAATYATRVDVSQKCRNLIICYLSRPADTASYKVALCEVLSFMRTHCNKNNIGYSCIYIRKVYSMPSTTKRLSLRVPANVIYRGLT